ncbi:endopeptidase [Tanacetum coccineum]
MIGKKNQSRGYSGRGVSFRWQPDEETLLAKCFVAVSEDRNVGSQEDAWEVLRKHSKWDALAPTPVDLTEDEERIVNTNELFGPDARPRPLGKQHSGKKTKSDTSESTGGSSSSSQFGDVMTNELRLKREAAEVAFEVAKEKDRTVMRLEEMKFLTISTKDLSEDDTYFIEEQKEAIRAKYNLYRNRGSNPGGMKRFRDRDDDGGDDSGGGFYSSVRPRTSGGSANKLTTMDASTYLKEIKETFKDQTEKYDEFFDAMKDFKAHRVDTPSIIARVRRLFQGYPDLILGFNTFLPKEYEITIDEPQAKKPVEFSEVYQFVNKIKVLTTMDARTYLKEIKEMFKDQKEKYDEFLDAMKNFKTHRVDTPSIIARVRRLFEGYPDLILGFNTFLPKVIITGVGATLQLQGGRRGTNSRDFISGMPDDILIMILSLLPVKDAIVTSILSTRWRFLMVFILS